LLIRNKLVTNKLLFTGFMLVLYMLPYTYSVFNGFSAMQYRWFYLFAFVVAQTVAYILDWMLLHKKNVNSLIGPLLATALFIYAFYRKVNINAQPLQTIDKILICTTVL
ncbi:multidrug transporter, partial [Bacillus pseudomycoides]